MTSARAARPSSVELLEALYPNPVRVVTRAASRPREPDRTIRYTAFPSVGRARILVSTGARRASARSIARQLTGQRPRTRIARHVIAAAARYGILDRVPGSQLTIAASGDDETIEQRLARDLGMSRVHVTIPVGPPRANRKPILQISDLAGDPLAFVKVGHNPLTHSLVIAEGQALRAVAHGTSGQIEVPRVRSEFNWNGSRVLVTSALQIPKRRLSGAEARERLRCLVLQIAGLGGPERRVVWRDHPLRRRLWSALENLGDVGRPFLSELAALDDHAEMSIGSWHGDFNPGNFALVAGPCPVWDWERYADGVPCGFDLLHHDLHRWITVERQAPTEAAVRLLAHSADVLEGVVPSATCSMAARTYLLTLAERYLRDGQERAGASLGRVTAWLLPALRQCNNGRAGR